MREKCKKCNTEFEGDVCPQCGEPIGRETAHEETTAQINSDSELSTGTADSIIQKDDTPGIPNSEFDSKKGKPLRTILELVGGTIIIILIIAVSKGVPKSDYQSLQEKYEVKVSELAKTSDELTSVKKELETYKQKMKPFEEMTAAQAEAEKIKAEQVAADKKAADEKAAAEKKAAEEQAAAEAAAAQAAQEALGYETGISYDQLARTPDQFITQKVKFYGKVIQVMESDSTVQIRLAVDDNYDTILLAEYLPSIVSSRILEDDHITIYGTSVGTISYKSTLGGTITIPGVYVDRIDQ